MQMWYLSRPLNQIGNRKPSASNLIEWFLCFKILHIIVLCAGLFYRISSYVDSAAIHNMCEWWSMLTSNIPCIHVAQTNSPISITISSFDARYRSAFLPIKQRPPLQCTSSN